MKPNPISFEPLEVRIAPATLAFVNPTTATYTDVDGDLVTVKFSKGILSEANVASVLVTSPIDPTHDQLQRIDLTVGGLAKPAAGTTITVTVAQAEEGDSFAHVGYINATGLDLGAVTIRGDLGAIDAGDATTKTPGLKSLTVQSFGTLGMTTGAPNLNSDIVGALGKLTVKGTMKDAKLDVTGGADGKVGPVNIGVSLIGGSTARSGSIHSTGSMGAVKIGVDLSGGSGSESGALLSDGKMGAVTIGHDIFGGFVASGVAGGQIYSKGDLGKVFVGGSVIGGYGEFAGAIRTDGKMADVKIVGDLRGGILQIATPPRSGFIGSGGDMGKVTVGGNLVGTFLPFSANISAGGKLAALTIGGYMQGSSEEHSGTITSMGPIGSIKVGGHIQGGTAPSSGSILTEGDIKTITVGGGLLGGTASQTGIISGKNLGKVTIGGAISGSGSQNSFSFTESGAILATSIQSLVIGGLFGGSAGDETLSRVGYISATKIIKSLTILGDVSGGSVGDGGSLTDSGSIQADQFGKITIGGNLTGGSKNPAHNATIMRSGAIQATHDIASLTVRGHAGDPNFSSTSDLPFTISAVGQLKPAKSKDLAIGSITIFGDADLLNIFAGYNPSLTPVNGGAQIGKVSVAGNWIASNLVAGVMNATSTNKNFGDASDAAIPTGSPSAIARIASISIGGVISGTTGGTDHFGFVSQAIGSFSIGGIKIPLTAAPSTLDLGATGDVSVHLI